MSQNIKKKSSIFSRLRSNFLTGLVIVVPVIVTFYLIWGAIAFIDDFVLPWVPRKYNPSQYFGHPIQGYGLVVFVVFTTFVGLFTKGLFGRQLLRVGENLVNKTPIVRSVYSGLKQIAETVFSQDSKSFEQACLIEYPRKGIWAIAFVSTKTTGEVPQKTGTPKMMSVFLPTTPNPTSGFLLFVPEKDAILLDMDVEEAAKMIISAGLVVPLTKEQKQAIAHKTNNSKKLA